MKNLLYLLNVSLYFLSETVIGQAKISKPKGNDEFCDFITQSATFDTTKVYLLYYFDDTKMRLCCMARIQKRLMQIHIQKPSFYLSSKPILGYLTILSIVQILFVIVFFSHSTSMQQSPKMPQTKVCFGIKTSVIEIIPERCDKIKFEYVGKTPQGNLNVYNVRRLNDNSYLTFGIGVQFVGKIPSLANQQKIILFPVITTVNGKFVVQYKLINQYNGSDDKIYQIYSTAI